MRLRLAPPASLLALGQYPKAVGPRQLAVPPRQLALGPRLHLALGLCLQEDPNENLLAARLTLRLLVGPAEALKAAERALAGPDFPAKRCPGTLGGWPWLLPSQQQQ